MSEAVKSLLDQMWEEATEPGEFDGMTDAQISAALRHETAVMLQGQDEAGLSDQIERAMYSIRCEMELLEQVAAELKRRNAPQKTRLPDMPTDSSIH